MNSKTMDNSGTLDKLPYSCMQDQEIICDHNKDLDQAINNSTMVLLPNSECIKKSKDIVQGYSVDDNISSKSSKSHISYDSDELRD